MKKTFVLIASLLTFNIASNGQCESIASACHKNNFSVEYISDGQNYSAFLAGDQEAEFTTTFFAGATYRIAACTGQSQGNLIFRVKDEESNVLFDSQEFGNTPFWDFKVKSTTTVTVTAQLDVHEVQSGCASILIGFKK